MHYNCHTCFSLRYGTLTVDQLLDEALEKGITTLAITDINNTSAPLEFVMKAREKGIRPIVGIEFRENNQLRYIGLARNAQGFQRLNEFLSAHLHAAALGNPTPPPTSPSQPNTSAKPFTPQDTTPTPYTPPAYAGRALPAGERQLVFPTRAPQLPDTFFIYPFSHCPTPPSLLPHEFVGIRPAELNRLFTSPLRHVPDKLLTFTPVTFRNKTGFNTHRLLRAIDRNTILSKQDPLDVAAADEIMLPMDAVLQHYQHHPHLVTNTLRLLDACTFDMAFDRPKNKIHFTTSRADDRQLLEKLAWDGFLYRYGKDNREARDRIRKELDVIDKLGFSAYFLITWDFIRYGHSRGFFHVGRGSGANSIVAYCMGITDVDPIDLDLYFERFLNPHRTSPPDFDIDFSWTDRDDVIDYVFKRYGHAHTTLMATYNTFKGRSIIRELGKVFGLPKAEIDSLVAQRHLPSLDDNIVRLIYRYGKELEGLPNHLGIHPGGILISEKPVRCYSATDLPPKGFPIVQFDMFVAEDAGLYKYDVLSQRGLGHIKSSYEIVRENRGVTVDVHDVKQFKADPKIAELVRSGNTIGCFYVESPAMRQLLTKLRCDNYLTLVAASSVIRPGVARSGMMAQYIERHREVTGLSIGEQEEVELSISDDRFSIGEQEEAELSISDDRFSIGEQEESKEEQGKSKIENRKSKIRTRKLKIRTRKSEIKQQIAKGWFLHPKMAEILAETYGVMVYQEDVIKVAHHFGGVDLGEADILRRAMSGKYRSKNHFDLLRDKFFSNCRERGYKESITTEVWRQMESFSGYSFCKAHSASFAVESYQSLFFKAHYPLEFMVGVINNFGGFYRTEVYLHEARRAGAVVHAPCVNHARYLTHVQGVDLWLGFVHLLGLEKKLAEGIVAAREAGGAFLDLPDLLRRTALGLESVTILIRIGALRFTGKSKKKLLWEANMYFSKAPKRKQATALFAPEEKDWVLPDLPDDPVEDAYDCIELLGFVLPPEAGRELGLGDGLRNASEDGLPTASEDSLQKASTPRPLAAGGASFASGESGHKCKSITDSGGQRPHDNPPAARRRGVRCVTTHDTIAQRCLTTHPPKNHLPNQPPPKASIRPPIFNLLAKPLQKGEITAANFPQFIGKRVFISGYLICTKQVRTIKKDMMGFCDFIDVNGEFFDATLFPQVYMKYPLTGIGIYRMVGKVANDFGVPSLEVEAIERLGYVGDPRRE